jgi:N-acetylmuramoyl-L-alanine amidase
MMRGPYHVLEDHPTPIAGVLRDVQAEALSGCSEISRREFLISLGLVAVATSSLTRSPVLPLLPPSRAASGLPVHPRSAWGADLPPVGPLEPEEPRFLLVHHTAGSNDYSQDSVPSILQGIYRYHTGTKGWPDIAYNFLVDRYGGIWEGRQGSLIGPVRGDATGGSQGFDQLCCFIGNHQVAPPTVEAVGAMVELLAAVAERYSIDPSPGATVQFLSRGSNRWPQGTEVTARTIEGHRRMSLTICPGDYVFALLDAEIPTRVARLAGSPTHVASPSAAPTPSPSPRASSVRSSKNSPTHTQQPSPPGSGRPAAAAPSNDSGGLLAALIAAGGAVGSLIGLALVASSRWGRRYHGSHRG